MQAAEKLCQAESLATVEVTRPKHLLKLGIELCPAVPEVHDLQRFLKADAACAFLVIHHELNNIEQSTWLVTCWAMQPAHKGILTVAPVNWACLTAWWLSLIKY